MAEFKLAAFSYTSATPDGYICGDCGTGGVRLYRRYQAVLDAQDLRCTTCALKHQKMQEPDGKHTVGWLVAAVPTEDGSTFWGYTSVPQAGVEWWDRLPVTQAPSEGGDRG